MRAGYLEVRARGVAAPAFFLCCGRGMVTPRFRYRQFDPLRAPAAENATVLPLVTRGAKRRGHKWQQKRLAVALSASTSRS